jgi:hypothetical protein
MDKTVCSSFRRKITTAMTQCITIRCCEMLGQAGLMSFDYIPLGPLSPLRIINDMVK